MDNKISNCIKAINKDTVHKICSGQVVLSLAVAVKELVENALDAGATNIDIRLKNYGIELIEVLDNGSGVTEDNFAALTLKYHTSKLRDYSDLLGVSSYGFRGEALSSLCELSDLTITTRHQSVEYATKLEFDHKGNIVKKSPCSRLVGTTVSLTNLFSSLPVRQKEFNKNAKREFNKMTQLLYAYCLISRGVKITCSNQTNANNKNIVVATQGSMSYKDNLICLFGLKQLHSILEIKPEYVSNIKENIFKGLSREEEETEEQTIDDVDINLSEDSNDTDIKNSQDTYSGSQKSQGHRNVPEPIELTGYISSCAHGSGRSSTDRQFYYINSRPCEPTKLIKTINETYRQYNPNQYPFVFLNINMERATVDVNVTPDKRKIFLTKEKIILEVLKNSLHKLFESIPRTLKMQQSQEFTKKFGSKDQDQSTGKPNSFNSLLQQFHNKSKKEPSIDSKESKLDLKRKSTTMLNFVSTKSTKLYDKPEIRTSFTIPDNLKENIQREYDVAPKNKSSENIELEESNLNLKQESPINDTLYFESEKIPNQLNTIDDLNMEQETAIKDIMYLESDKMPNTQIRTVDDIVVLKSHTNTCRNKSASSNNPAEKVKSISTNVVTDKGDIGKNIRRFVNLKTSMEHVKQLVNIFEENKYNIAPERVKFKSTINPVHNKKCEEELSKEISKDSFLNMEIIGQFNLGFIITRLNDDLFIIDQHATDEIYNFEMLQKTTELTNQKLVVPQSLELTGVNEQILMDNLEIFKKNGFTFIVDENAPPTKRVKLLTIPMSKNWIFGKEDIEELLFMLRESSSEYCRPSRVRAMFASRACRKSVMIGTALSKSDMRKLVTHMAEIEKPWNCPHGRPTIRHLVNLAMVRTNEE